MPARKKWRKPGWSETAAAVGTVKTGAYLVKLLRHLADDLGVLHVPEHLDPHRSWKTEMRTIRGNDSGSTFTNNDGARGSMLTSIVISVLNNLI